MPQSPYGRFRLVVWMIVAAMLSWWFDVPIRLIVVSLLMIFAALLIYDTVKPWRTYFLVCASCERPQILARGRVDGGYFVIVRHRIAGIRAGDYPFLLTRILFDQDKKCISARSRIIAHRNEEGGVKVGTYQGDPVVIRLGNRRWPSISFDRPDGVDSWQVFPPVADQILRPRVLR